MTVYHIGKDGDPKECRAKKDNCPLGGEHFTSLVDARTAAELKIAAEQEQYPMDRILEDTFSVMQRRRMFQRNPKMHLLVPENTVVVSSSGDLWRVLERIPGETVYDSKLKLRNRRSGKQVIVETKADPTKKATSRQLSDFALLTPVAFEVDGPPVHDSPRFKKFEPGTREISDIVLTKIRVTTVDNKLEEMNPRYGVVGYGDDEYVGELPPEEHYRYLAIYPAKLSDLNDKEKRHEFSLAIWKQAGRSEESWSALTEIEKDDLVRYSHEVKTARFTNRDDRVRFENQDLGPMEFDSFLLPKYMASDKLCGYDLNATK